MKIEVLRNLGPGLPKYLEGQVVEVDEKQGQELIDLGLAVIKAIPKKPNITAPAPDPVDLTVENSDSMKRFKAKGRKPKRDE